MSCDPGTLITNARCLLNCIPAGLQSAAQTAMLTSINGGETNLNTLMQQAKEYIWRVPPMYQTPMQIYLLLVILEGTNRSVDELLRSASCMRCIPKGYLPPIQTSELCEWKEGGTGGCNNPIVLDWLQRMANNGVTLPSTDTIRAVCDFCNDLDLYGLTDQMLVVNPVIPDSLSSMRFPLIYQAGNGFSPFLMQGFVAADLNENGIVGDGSIKYFDTGFVPFDHWGLNLDSFGLHIYQSDFTTGVADEIDVGVTDVGPNKFMQLSSWTPSTTEKIVWGWNNLSQTSAPGGETLGFHSGIRSSVNRLDYYENGVSIANNAAAQAGDVVPDTRVYFMCVNDNSGALNQPLDFVTSRISFMAITEKMNLAEEQNFRTAVQSLRIGLGGGWA